MESGRDECKQELTFETEKGGELRVSSTNMSEQLGGGISECQGSRHEKSIFPALPLEVYPAEKLSQRSYLGPQDDSKDLSSSSYFDLADDCNVEKLQTRPDDAEPDEETPKLIPTRGLDKGSDVCKDSSMDLMSVNLSPDDVVSAMGQIHFWKARSTIANQQRLYVAQVFELHRLIKVQKLIAESPDLMFDEGAYLGNPLKASPPKRARVSHDVKHIPNIDKHGVVDEETDKEKAVEKTPISSSQIDNKLSNYEQRSGLIGHGPLPNLVTGDYLCPASSPAISLPPSLIPSTPPSLDKMEALHKCYQNIYNMLHQYNELAKEVLKFSPSENACASIGNTSSHTTQTNPYTPASREQRSGLIGLLFGPQPNLMTGNYLNHRLLRPCWPAFSPAISLPPTLIPSTPPSLDKIEALHKCYRDIYNMVSQYSALAKEVLKFSPSNNKVCASIANTSSHTAQTSPCTATACPPPGVRAVLTLMPPSSDSMYKMDYHKNCYRTLRNVLFQNKDFFKEVMRFSSSISKVSMASTSSMAAPTTSCTLERAEQPVLFISPMPLTINFETFSQPIQDFNALHQNAGPETPQDESDATFNSSDDDSDSDYLSSSSDARSTATDAESDKETPRIVPLTSPASDSTTNG